MIGSENNFGEWLNKETDMERTTNSSRGWGYNG